MNPRMIPAFRHNEHQSAECLAVFNDLHQGFPVSQINMSGA